MAKVFKPNVYKEYVSNMKKDNENIVLIKRLRGGLQKKQEGKIADIFDNYFNIKYPNYSEGVMYKELYTGECILKAGE